MQTTHGPPVPSVGAWTAFHVTPSDQMSVFVYKPKPTVQKHEFVLVSSGFQMLMMSNMKSGDRSVCLFSESGTFLRLCLFSLKPFVL